MPEQCRIDGRIALPDGLRGGGFTVHAFDRDLPSRERRAGMAPTLLGAATTDAEGRFQILYDLERFEAGDGFVAPQRARTRNADLSFKVSDAVGRELAIRNIEARGVVYPPEQIIFNVAASFEVRIVVDAPADAQPSELERYLTLIAPVVEDVPLAELTDDDLAYLHNELALEEQAGARQHLDWLRWSSLFARITSLPVEAFYAWARTATPALWTSVEGFDDAERRDAVATRLLAELASLPAETLAAQVARAAEARLIPARLRERAAALARAIRRRALRRYTVQLRLENATTGAALAQQIVTVFDTDAGNAELGTDVTNSLGEFEVDYFATEDAATAGYTLRFRVRGPAVGDGAETTQRIVAAEAPPIAVRLQTPATGGTLQELRQAGRIDAPETYLATLERTFGVRSLADIRRLGGVRRIAELRELDATVAHRLDALADLDRLSVDANEAAALLAHRYDSVLAIAEMPRDEFTLAMSAPAAGLTMRRATELHIAAKAQTELLDQILIGIAADAAYGIAPGARLAVGDYFPPLPEEHDRD